MYTKEKNMLNILTNKAQQMGYHLSIPEIDMYGRYECTIEEIATGIVNVSMNHRSQIDAARTALSEVLVKAKPSNNNACNKVASYEFEGA